MANPPLPSPEAEDSERPGPLLYICTTFPKLSETFIQREVAVLRRWIDLRVVSLWGGDQTAGPCEVVRLPDLLHLFYILPYWLIRRPRAIGGLLRPLFRRRPADWLNFQETALGLGMGLLIAFRWRHLPPAWIHGIWATAPATTAMVVSHLLRRPWSFGAHAYDIFQGGGDWLLPEKIASARWIQSSTRTAQAELERRGASPERLLHLFRGMVEFPPFRSPQTPLERPLRLISVGRLVEKKGLFEQLDILAALAKNTPFEARICGGGELAERLQEHAASLGLSTRVTFTGECPPTEVAEGLAWADLFLFTGKVSASGDRDGLPNAVVEAMAAGVPVLAHHAPGVAEAIESGKTGVLLDDLEPGRWVKEIESLLADHEQYARIARCARQWAEENFSAAVNSGKLARHFRESCTRSAREALDGKDLLIARTDRIGDVVISTSFIEAIHRLLPSARLHWLVSAEVADLFHGDPRFASVLPLPANLTASERQHQVRALMQAIQPAALIELHPDKDLRTAARQLKIPLRAGFSKCWQGNRHLTHSTPYRKASGTRHEADYNLDLLNLLGLPRPAKAPLPRLTLTPRGLPASLTGDLSQTLVFHPYAFGKKPRWPLEHYVRLGEMVRQAWSMRIVLIGSHPSPETIPEDWLDLGGKLSLPETTALLSESAALVTRDSGPAHLAAAVGGRVVCLMGQCDPVHSPRRWAPLGESAITLTANLPPLPGEKRAERWSRSFASIRPEQVFEALKKLILKSAALPKAGS